MNQNLSAEAPYNRDARKADDNDTSKEVIIQPVPQVWEELFNEISSGRKLDLVKLRGIDISDVAADLNVVSDLLYVAQTSKLGLPCSHLSKRILLVSPHHWGIPAFGKMQTMTNSDRALIAMYLRALHAIPFKRKNFRFPPLADVLDDLKHALREFFTPRKNGRITDSGAGLLDVTVRTKYPGVLRYSTAIIESWRTFGTVVEESTTHTGQIAPGHYIFQNRLSNNKTKRSDETVEIPPVTVALGTI
jgi:hypothetical protein